MSGVVGYERGRVRARLVADRLTGRIVLHEVEL